MLPKVEVLHVPRQLGQPQMTIKRPRSFAFCKNVTTKRPQNHHTSKKNNVGRYIIAIFSKFSSESTGVKPRNSFKNFNFFFKLDVVCNRFTVTRTTSRKKNFVRFCGHFFATFLHKTTFVIF